MIYLKCCFHLGVGNDDVPFQRYLLFTVQPCSELRGEEREPGLLLLRCVAAGDRTHVPLLMGVLPPMSGAASFSGVCKGDMSCQRVAVGLQ